MVDSLDHVAESKVAIHFHTAFHIASGDVATTAASKSSCDQWYGSFAPFVNSRRLRVVRRPCCGSSVHTRIAASNCSQRLMKVELWCLAKVALRESHLRFHCGLLLKMMPCLPNAVFVRLPTSILCMTAKRVVTRYCHWFGSHAKPNMVVYPSVRPTPAVLNVGLGIPCD